ncbi:MAG: dihydroorotate dehydrogenase 2, partial [Pseudomonadota bacterium]
MLDRFNPLQLLPPETAHGIALGLAKRGLVPAASEDPDNLAVELLGKRFRNPIGLSAGADKNATGLIGWEKMGFGFLEAGTVTVKPREGNPSPRIWRLGEQDSLVNWLGLPGPGMDPFIENLKRYRARASQSLVIGVSIASPDGKLADFTTLARATAAYADYFTLNASCPNVAHGSAVTTNGEMAEKDTGPVADMINQIQASLAGADGTPVLVKLGPTDDETVFKTMVEAALKAGAAGIVATNTIPPDRRALIKDADFAWPQHEGASVGGYSGPALNAIACQMVSWARAVGGADMPLMGVGGHRHLLV